MLGLRNTSLQRADLHESNPIRVVVMLLLMVESSPSDHGRLDGICYAYFVSALKNVFRRLFH